MNSGQLKREKRRLRTEILARRDAIGEADRARLGRLATERCLELPSVQAADTAMLFWPFGSEIDTRRLIELLSERGVRIALPRIVGTEIEPRTWRPGEALDTTDLGVSEPTSGALVDMASIDVIVTPAVAFDRAGHRIGYGGGFYDRFFPKTRPGAMRLGFCFDLQVVVGELPGGHFDQRVHLLVTERESIDAVAGGDVRT